MLRYNHGDSQMRRRKKGVNRALLATMSELKNKLFIRTSTSSELGFSSEIRRKKIFFFRFCSLAFGNWGSKKSGVSFIFVSWTLRIYGTISFFTSSLEGQYVGKIPAVYTTQQNVFFFILYKNYMPTARCNAPWMLYAHTPIQHPPIHGLRRNSERTRSEPNMLWLGVYSYLFSWKWLRVASPVRKKVWAERCNPSACRSTGLALLLLLLLAHTTCVASPTKNKIK